jgi:argininosuccinate lyase
MPQKRNPDYAELVRARAGTVYGCLLGALSICKALPYSYNRDLQEVTPHLLRAAKIASASVAITAGMVDGLEVTRETMERQAPAEFTVATELADTIVRETGIPFRTAHRIVSALAAELTEEQGEALQDQEAGKAIVAELLQRLDAISVDHTGKTLSELGLTEKKVKEALNVSLNIQKRKVKGGPAKREMERMLERRKADLEKDEKMRVEREERVRRSFDELDHEVRRRKRLIKVIKKPTSNFLGVLGK